MKSDSTDVVLEKIITKSESYGRLSYSVIKTFLDTYDPICRIKNCFLYINEIDVEEDLAHFGYFHIIVSDNARTFSFAEFQLWCHQRCIKHLTSARYHPVANGAAEKMM